MTIPFLCTTKNRAAQCRLLLESINRNAPGIFTPHILWKADPEYLPGYQKLMQEQWVKDMGAVFVQEGDLLAQIYEFLHNAGGYFALFMDDCILYRKIECTEADIKNELDTTPVWCVSLRLGKNTKTQDYLTGEQQPDLVEVSSGNKLIRYEFKTHHPHKNYGFHFSWDGVIYRTADVLEMFGGTDFTHTDNQHAILPQRIENHMMNRRDQVKYDLMSCPEHSAVVCMNWNCTHQYATPGQKFAGGMKEFQELYMLDYVIDLDSIDFSNVKSCHEELGFTYKKL